MRYDRWYKDHKPKRELVKYCGLCKCAEIKEKKVRDITNNRIDRPLARVRDAS